MAYLQIVLLSLALCLGIDAFSAIPSKYWHRSITYQYLDNLRDDQIREKIQQQLMAIGSFQVSMAPNAFLRSLLYAVTTKPIGRQIVGQKDEFSTKNAKKYNDDPCDDSTCLHACNFFFDKDYGFCPEVQWCVCYD